MIKITGIFRAYMLSLLVVFSAEQSTSCCLLAQDSPLGSLLIMRKAASNFTTSQCVLPVKVKDRFFICTPITGQITSESTLAVELSSGRFNFVPLVAVIEGVNELAQENRTFILNSGVFTLCFFPLVETAPQGDKESTIWSSFRARAVDLEATGSRVGIPSNVFLISHNLSVDRSIVFQPKEFKVVDRKSEGLWEVAMDSMGKQIDYLVLDRRIERSEYGAPCFTHLIEDNGQSHSHFVGLSIGNPNLEGEKSYDVILEAGAIYEIFKVYEQLKKVEDHE